MPDFPVSVSFRTNLGNVAADSRAASAAVRDFGTTAGASVATVERASAGATVAVQRLRLEQAKLAIASKELQTVQLSGVASIRTQVAAMDSYLASVERVAAAQRAVTVEQRAVTAPHVTAFGVIGSIAAVIGIQKLIAGYREGAQAALQLQAIQRQTNVEIENTGGEAGVSADHVSKLAGQISAYSGANREAVQSAENLLLTQSSIRNAGDTPIFDRAIKDATDLAYAYSRLHGGSADVASMARTLGLALNDPARGLDHLRRAGLSFTEDQRKSIKALTDTGQVAQADALILSFLEQKVRGSAAAFGDTTAGQVARAREAFRELEIELAQDLSPAVRIIAEDLGGLFRFLGTHPEVTQAALAFGALAASLFTIHEGIKAIGALRNDFSSVLNVASRILPFRSLERVTAQLEARETAHAESATLATEAEVRLAQAEEAGVGPATAAAAAQSRLAGTQAVAAETTRLDAIIARSRGVGTGVVPPVVGPGFLSRSGLLSRAGTGVGIAVGGQLVGQLIQSQVGGQAGREVGRDLSAAATGAALGFTVGGPIGAGVGAAGGLAFAERNRIGGFVSGLFGGGNRDLAQETQYVSVTAQLAQQHANLAAAFDKATNGAQQQVIAERLLAVQHAQLKDAALTAAEAASRQAEANYAAAEKNVATARSFLAQLQAGNAQAMGQVEQVTGSLAGIFDAPTIQPSNAAAMQSAGDAARTYSDAQDRVRLAEQRLADVRAKQGKVSASTLLSAEMSLKHAKEAEAAASDKASAAEHKATSARTTTALSIQQVLARASQQVAYVTQQAEAARTLVRMGISAPVLAGLEQLDKQAPGTLVEVAKHMTRGYADQLNRDQTMQQGAQRAIDVAWGGATLSDAQKVAAALAVAQNQAWISEWVKLLSDPAAVAELRNTPVGQLLTAGLAGVPGAGAITGGAPTSTTNTATLPIHRQHGGPVPGALDAPVPAVLHGGEYVLSRPMLAGLGEMLRRPAGSSNIGGAATIVRVVEQPVVIHHHTMTNATHVGQVRAHNYDDFTRQMRQRAQRSRVASA